MKSRMTYCLLLLLSASAAWLSVDSLNQHQEQLRVRLERETPAQLARAARRSDRLESAMPVASVSAVESPLAQEESRPEQVAESKTQEEVEEAVTSDRPQDGQVLAGPEAPIAPSVQPLVPEPAPDPDEITDSEGLVIHSDYQKAMKEAVEDRKMLFIYFHEPNPTAAQMAFEKLTLADPGVQEQLKRYVCVKVACNQTISIDGEPITVLKHAAFTEMLNRQGIAIVDLVHERADYYGHVVSTFPFTTGKYYRKEAVSIILHLPPGTLTQRTMIYAVRIHPEGPASTQGQFHNVLAEEAKNHAIYQASILVQGHHSWDSRFQRINSKLPNGVLAQEVVAESWPNESLVEACVDCVHSWRQSPGHWGAVRSRHPLFGYDIKRGRNGIWYATGIFGQR